jgi:hypothetical protein
MARLYLKEAARDDVIVTQGGKPWVILRAVANTALSIRPGLAPARS